MTTVEIYFLIFLLTPCCAFQHFEHRQIRNLQHQKLYTPPLDIKDFVSLANVNRKVKQNQVVTAKYQCTKPLIILFFVDGYHYDIKQEVDATHNPDIFFRTAWNCTPSTVATEQNVTIKYPKEIVLGPSPLLPKVWNIQNATLKVAMVDKIAWMYASELKYLKRDVFHILYEKAVQTLSLPLQTTAPYCRENKLSDKCYTWEFDLLDGIFRNHMPKSYHDDAAITLTPYPMAMYGGIEGLVKKFYPFINPELRVSKLTDPNFVFTALLFVTNYCKGPLCGILTKIGSDNEYYTPSLFIKNDGHLMAQTTLVDKKRYAVTTPFLVPLQQWVRIVWDQKGSLTNITIRYGMNFSESNNFHAEFHLPVHVDYPDGYMTLGGNQFVTTFSGFFGDAHLIRGSSANPEKILFPKKDHLMYTLGIEKFFNEGTELRQALLNKRQQVLENTNRGCEKDVCLQPFAYTIRLYSGLEVCAAKPSVLPKKFQKLESMIGLKLSRQLTDDEYIEKFAKRAFQKSLAYLEDVKKPMKLINLLDLSAKLGNRHANFFLYAIYINGMFVDVDENKAQLYLLMGAYNGCRLSTKALGNNFLTGKDGFPINEDLSFFYYFNAAHFTQWDKRKHSEEMTAVNEVRLSDEKEMKKQLNEDEDSFQWLKFQASKGILGAKKSLASMLFWGQQGLKRDLSQAFEYYKEAALDTDDPVALYDYGIALIRGFGTEVDIEAGVAIMEKAATLNSVAALNTLGW